jgi:hypothetical protein
MAHHRNRRLTVEQCRIVDVGCLKQDLRRVDYETSFRSVIEWRDSSGRTEAVLGYEVGRTTSEGLIVLTDPERTSPFPASVRLRGEYVIPIATTQAHIGVRHWFRCPVEHDGKPCGRRVKKLYLPPGEQFFGCRLCHALTYRSTQQHDKRKAALARDPDALGAALGSEDLRRVSLAIEALPLALRQAHSS